MSSQDTLNFAVIGCGGVTLQNHLPGLALCPDVKVVALCDADAATLERARQQTGVSVTGTGRTGTSYADPADDPSKKWARGCAAPGEASGWDGSISPTTRR